MNAISGSLSAHAHPCHLSRWRTKNRPKQRQQGNLSLAKHTFASIMSGKLFVDLGFASVDATEVKMADTTYESLVASLRRARANDFPKCFYESFLKRRDIKVMFEHTDLQVQTKMLVHGLTMLLKYGSGDKIGEMAIIRLGEKHRNDLKVPDALYPFFVETLITTLSHTDPQWMRALERSWRTALGPGIELMRHGL